jgi:hypothetical protein
MPLFSRSIILTIIERLGSKGTSSKPPAPVKLTNLLVEWMREHAKAPDVTGGTQSRRKRE